MENQFDNLTKALAQGVSRREALRQLAGVFAVGLLGPVHSILGTKQRQNPLPVPDRCRTLCKSHCNSSSSCYQECVSACHNCSDDEVICNIGSDITPDFHCANPDENVVCSTCNVDT